MCVPKSHPGVSTGVSLVKFLIWTTEHRECSRFSQTRHTAPFQMRRKEVNSLHIPVEKTLIFSILLICKRTTMNIELPNITWKEVNREPKSSIWPQTECSCQGPFPLLPTPSPHTHQHTHHQHWTRQALQPTIRVSTKSSHKLWQGPKSMSVQLTLDHHRGQGTDPPTHTVKIHVITFDSPKT